MISAFDIFKIGVGPSSSHTVGPMNAGKSFVDLLKKQGLTDQIDRISVDLYGSLSLTGKGHATDTAIIVGLLGNTPQEVNPDEIPVLIQKVAESGYLSIPGRQTGILFPLPESITFHNTALSLHENGMRISAWRDSQGVLIKTYYSIGGGFIVEEESFDQEQGEQQALPYPFRSASELFQLCEKHAMSVSEVMMQNELALRCKADIHEGIAKIWQAMRGCIERGINTEGTLPGPLKVSRRAGPLYRMLTSTSSLSKDPMNVIDWLNLFALAVNEENAAGGRVVTAPTNGACGIVPAVLSYYDKFHQAVDTSIATRYFLTSSAVGGLYKMNASISGAEVGCQGEVGVAASMAAAGLTELLGGDPTQVFMAAEIAMEHNLGLTCDPVAGQVQVPCIERNAINAVKAVNAARMALSRTSESRVSLDKVIETMYETGKDMNVKYRETSRGGLAIKVLCH